MSPDKKPLKPNDFPVHHDGTKSKNKAASRLHKRKNPAVAADIADRLNDDEAIREEDKWSA